MSHAQIRDWMSSAPPTISPKDSVRHARRLLHTAKTEELLVMDNGKLVGMLNERDIWHHCPTSALMMEEQRVNELLEQFRVAAVMSLHPPVIAPNAQLTDAAQLFAESGREGIAVVEDGIAIGFLTEARFMHAIALLFGSDANYDTHDSEPQSKGGHTP